MVNSKNILYISYDGMTDPLGQSQVLPYLTNLVQEGYSFTLISCEKPEKFEAVGSTIQEICNKYTIDWHPFPYTKSPPVLSTLKDVRAMRKLALSLHKEKNFRIVHCRSYISSLIGLEMKRKYGVGFLFDMRGLWANEKVDAGAWNLKKPVYRIIYKYYKNKERQFFTEASYTISLTQAGKEEIHSWKSLPNNPVPIQVIPCCVDMGHFLPATFETDRRVALAMKLDFAEGDYILTYLGSIGTWYMLPEMIDFFVELLKQKPTAKFLFITGDEHEKIKSVWLEKNLPLSKLSILKGERKDVPTLISLSDASIFFIRPTYSKVSSSPTKQGELMAMGVPVICNDGVGDTAFVIRKYNSGIVVSEFTDKAYSLSIGRLLNTPFNKVSIRKGAVEFYGLKKGIRNYLDVYEAIEKRD